MNSQNKKSCVIKKIFIIYYANFSLNAILIKAIR